MNRRAVSENKMASKKNGIHKENIDSKEIQTDSIPRGRMHSTSIKDNLTLLKDEVEAAIKDIDDNDIGIISVGKTKIQKNKAVILSWCQNQKISSSISDANQDTVNDEGFVFYVAIKMKKKNLKIRLSKDEVTLKDSKSNSEMEDFGISMCDNSDTVFSFPATDGDGINNTTGNAVSISGESATGRSIKSAISRRRAKKNWLRLVTTMRNVNIADCEDMFIKDEYRKIQFNENDMIESVYGQYLVKTPPLDETEDDTPSKRRVRWRETLEDAYYDNNDCLVVDISDKTGACRLEGRDTQNDSKRQRRKSKKGVKQSIRSNETMLIEQVKRDEDSFSDSEIEAGISERLTSFVDFTTRQSQSAPNSPVKSPQHKATTLQRSRSADRHTILERHYKHKHQHEYREQSQGQVRRVRCRHSGSNDGIMWLYGGPNSFNRRVSNKSVRKDYATNVSSSQYYAFRSTPRASKEIKS